MKNFFKNIDEDTKKYSLYFYIFLAFLITIYSLWGIKNTQTNEKENIIAVDRSPLSTFRFLEYKENEDGGFIDFVDVETGKKYKDIFISSTCAKGNEKKPGLLMKLYVVKYINYSTNETSYRFNRAYDYICTNKNMVKEDEILLRKIKEFSEDYIKQIIQDEEEELRKNPNKNKLK